MEKFLSATDVSKVVGQKPMKVIISSEFHKINNLSEVLNDETPDVLILFQNNHQANVISGHWCCMKLLDDTLLFYDSYGSFPTDQLKRIPKSYRKQTNQCKNYLAQLMLDSGYDIHYNNYKHQKRGSGINTCGRHSGYFLRNNLFPDEYNSKYNISDSNIVRITNPLLHQPQ